MPPRIRLIGRYGNGAAAVLFGSMVLFSLGRGSFGATLVLLALAALAAFNVYVIEKVAQVTSEEEFLKAEVRKAELRKELASFGAFATDSNTVTSGPPAPERIDR